MTLQVRYHGLGTYHPEPNVLLPWKRPSPPRRSLATKGPSPAQRVPRSLKWIVLDRTPLSDRSLIRDIACTPLLASNIMLRTTFWGECIGLTCTVQMTCICRTLRRTRLIDLMRNGTHAELVARRRDAVNYTLVHMRLEFPPVRW